ncbi:MAG: conjugal transfer protein TraG, partial [Bradyrhizobium sp.]|nr:conjugal transfer protein TraG [Bradyrhizobium sp.]
FADNDLLVSSSTGFQRSARSDTSTRFEAGKQAGPDTVEHFLGGGPEGHAMMANWLQGGFEMDRHGNWRLKPQVADTLQRDVQAVMAQTGWQRALSRSAEKQDSMSTTVDLGIGAGASAGSSGQAGSRGKKGAPGGGLGTGHAGGSAAFNSTETGRTSSSATATMDIVNYDVRNAIAAAERVASRSANPERAFSDELSRQVLGPQGLRNRYLENADSGRGTFDYVAPLTSMEQSSVLGSGRLSGDRDHSSGDGDPSFKTRND